MLCAHLEGDFGENDREVWAKFAFFLFLFTFDSPASIPLDLTTSHRIPACRPRKLPLTIALSVRGKLRLFAASVEMFTIARQDVKSSRVALKPARSSELTRSRVLTSSTLLTDSSAERTFQVSSFLLSRLMNVNSSTNTSTTFSLMVHNVTL